MNILIAILLCFAFLGALDKIIGGKLGIAGEFDRGLAAMGPLCLSMSGVYCVAVAALSSHPERIAAWGEVLPFDPSVLAGALLAPDLGGYPIAYCCVWLSGSLRAFVSGFYQGWGCLYGQRGFSYSVS